MAGNKKMVLQNTKLSMGVNEIDLKKESICYSMAKIW
jgi:hypothetical protein